MKIIRKRENVDTISLLREREGNLVDTLPEDYEIYEHPYSQVFLRKIQPQIIADTELHIIDEHLKKLKVSKRYLSDVAGKIVTIFESNEDIDILKEIISAAHPDGFTVESAIDFAVTYVPAMRFFLENEEMRTFIVQRYTFPGCVEEWRHIGGPDSIEKLAKEYLAHLGKESLYTLL